MGREIRRVPPNWDHPKSERYPDRFQPMYDRTFEQASREWKEGFAKWESGEDEDRKRYEADAEPCEYWEYHGGPPEREYYRPWKDEDATWYQVWETVSEGTPVTPPFATKDELATYLMTHGDFWDQKRGDGPWSEKSAIAFCRVGWTMTGMIADGQWIDGRDIPAATQS